MRPDTKANIDRQAAAAQRRVDNRMATDRLRELIEWAKEAFYEIRGMHDLAYAKCRGNCPTHYILDGLRHALESNEVELH